MIITIDGPAGAGKSSVARKLAERLGFRFLDTGAMYRAVALAGKRHGIDLGDAAALANLADQIAIDVDEQRVLLDGEDVTRTIRTSEITLLTRFAADNPRVRAILVERQREAAAGKDVVTEGRDQGTIVFPHAECKIFLDASPEERAKRRLRDLHDRGETPEYAEVLAQQEERDRRDRSRTVGPLILANDAEVVSTDGLAPDEVVDKLEALVRARMPH
jgi:CMP/dCMP kinase